MSYCKNIFLKVTCLRLFRNRNLGISRAPLKSPGHQLIRECCDKSRALSKG